jgi:hypothetical protein
MTFLKAQGIRDLAQKNDWLLYVEEEPEIYERDELDKLFAACNQEERKSCTAPGKIFISRGEP